MTDKIFINEEKLEKAKSANEELKEILNNEELVKEDPEFYISSVQNLHLQIFVNEILSAALVDYQKDGSIGGYVGDFILSKYTFEEK